MHSCDVWHLCGTAFEHTIILSLTANNSKNTPLKHFLRCSRTEEINKTTAVCAGEIEL